MKITTYNKDDLQRQIDFLENRLDLDRINPFVLRDELNKYFPLIPVGVLDIKKGTKIFRGRIHEGGPSYKKVQDFSYVPHDIKAKCKEFGRANLPMQSLFYSSNNLDTAQMECICKDIKNKIWFLSFGEWEVQEDLIVADIILHDIEQIKTTSVAKKRDHVHNLIKQDLDEKQFEYVKMILDFFGRQFAKTNIPTDRHYLLSVYLADRLLDLKENGRQIDGIQYPSIPMIYQGNNIVLKPTVVDNNKIKLIKTYEMVCGLGGGMQLQSKIENTSKEIKDSEIFWHKEGVEFYVNIDRHDRH